MSDVTPSKHRTEIADVRRGHKGISVEVDRWDFPEHDPPFHYDTHVFVETEGTEVEARVGGVRDCDPYLVVTISKGGDSVAMFIDRPVAEALASAIQSACSEEG